MERQKLKVKQILGVSISSHVYKKLKDECNGKNVSAFVEKAIAKELTEKERGRKELRKKMIAGYQANNMSRISNDKPKQSPHPFPHYGEIYLVYFNPKKGKEVGKLQNLVEVQIFEILIRANATNGLKKDSKILLNRLRAIDKELRLRDYCGVASAEIMGQ
ncbi:1129_t:CDS:2, partial [Gigaspora margarita]